MLGSSNSAANTSVGVGGNLLGLYNGIEKGGVVGDTGAAVNAAQLAAKAGQAGAAAGTFGGASSEVGSAAGELGAVAGYAAIPLAAYNAVNNYQSGNAGADALNDAELGAAIGSVVPVIGTAIGAVGGAVVGALSSLAGPGRQDAETADVNQVINATGQNGNSASVAASVQNPYLNLAGLFDDKSSTLPMYQQYGRMGEQQFTTDMVSQINDAYKAGTINSSSTPQQVYNSVVAPWVGGMGQGWSDVGATYTATTEGLLQDMVSQYMAGTASQNWKAVGGDSPFQNLPSYGGAPNGYVASSTTATNAGGSKQTSKA